ncbi:hypothetical protein [Verrucomicrobium spinosum]|uniref:hypothetical protein n=1 Tax=Verrucomicrobium spinosum TaxID=2736 RepID=UPI000174562A|nr:hypothetical protein [Verrucomicrobium spinosum]
MDLSSTSRTGRGQVTAWNPLPENAVYRISSRDDEAPAPSRRTAPRNNSDRGRAPSSAWCHLAAWLVAATLLGATAWDLRGARTQNAELSHEVAFLKEALSEHLNKLEGTQASLNVAQEERGAMISALRHSLTKQENLREDTDNWRLRHGQEVAAKTKAVATWATYGDQLASVVQQTNALRESEHEEATQQLASLETKTTQLSQANQNLASTAAEWEASARSLAGDNRNLQQELERTQSCAAHLEVQNRDLCGRNSQLLSDVLSLNACISGLRSTICQLESRIRCLESELSQARSANNASSGSSSNGSDSGPHRPRAR